MGRYVKRRRIFGATLAVGNRVSWEARTEILRFVKGRPGGRRRFWLMEIMNVVGLPGIEMARREKESSRKGEVEKDVLTELRGELSSGAEGPFLESGLPH